MTTQYKWIPNVPTEEMKLVMANAFIASLQVAQKESYDLTDPDICSTILGFVFEQGWKAAPEVEQEPVGKIVLHDCSYIGELFNSNDIYVEGTPLYTHPQPKD
jgi:hypothetical protein